MFYLLHVLSSCSGWPFVVLRLVHHSEQHVTSYPQQWFYLGQSSRTLWGRIRKVWRAHLCFCSMLRDEPISPSFCRHPMLFQQQHQSGSERVVTTHWRNWTGCSCGVTAWCPTCAHWGVCVVSGHLESSQVKEIPVLPIAFDFISIILVLQLVLSNLCFVVFVSSVCCHQHFIKKLA